MRLCDLSNKQVINTYDGSIIGIIADVSFDPDNGCICDVIIPGPPRFCSLFGHDTEYIIPFKCIKNIGDDVVIVSVCLDEYKFKT